MRNAIYFVMLVILSSCGQSGEENTDERMKYGLAEVQDSPLTRQVSTPQTSQLPPSPEPTRKVIKTGNIRFRSDDMNEDRKSIADLLPGFEAYIENEGEDRMEGQISSNMTIRVPADNFDSLYNTISGMADHLESRSSNIQDATERYYDLETRISSKKALEQRYLELLDDASRMTDVLEIERSLNQVRTEIEQLQGQFNYLSKQISLSTLYLNFYEELPFDYEPGDQRGFFSKILQAFDNGWQAFLAFLVGFLTLWPFILLGVGVFLIIRNFRRKKRRG